MKETEISIELEFKVRFHVQPEEQQTLHYPGCPAAIEDISLHMLTKSGKYMELSPAVEREIIDMFEEEIEEACLEQAWEDAAEDAVAHAEHMRDMREDR